MCVQAGDGDRRAAEAAAADHVAEGSAWCPAADHLQPRSEDAVSVLRDIVGTLLGLLFIGWLGCHRSRTHGAAPRGAGRL